MTSLFSFVTHLVYSCMYPNRHFSLTNLTCIAPVRPPWPALAATEIQGFLPMHSDGLWAQPYTLLAKQSLVFCSVEVHSNLSSISSLNRAPPEHINMLPSVQPTDR